MQENIESMQRGGFVCLW